MLARLSSKSQNIYSYDLMRSKESAFSLNREIVDMESLEDYMGQFWSITFDTLHFGSGFDKTLRLNNSCRSLRT